MSMEAINWDTLRELIELADRTSNNGCNDAQKLMDKIRADYQLPTTSALTELLEKVRGRIVSFATLSIIATSMFQKQLQDLSDDETKTVFAINTKISIALIQQQRARQRSKERCEANITRDVMSENRKLRRLISVSVERFLATPDASTTALPETKKGRQ